MINLNRINKDKIINDKWRIDWVIKMGDVIISATEAKREDINQGVAQSSVQAHASLQCNRKKRTYDDADLYEGAMYCIVSTGMIVKQIRKNMTWIITWSKSMRLLLILLFDIQFQVLTG